MDGMLVYADCRIRHYIHEPNNGKYMYICYFLNYYVILLYWLPIIYGVVRLFSWENNKTGNWYHPFYLLIYFDCWISKDTEKLLWCKYCNRIKRPKYYWSRFIWGRNCLLQAAQIQLEFYLGKTIIYWHNNFETFKQHNIISGKTFTPLGIFHDYILILLHHLLLFIFLILIALFSIRPSKWFAIHIFSVK